MRLKIVAKLRSLLALMLLHHLPECTPGAQQPPPPDPAADRSAALFNQMLVSMIQSHSGQPTAEQKVHNWVEREALEASKPGWADLSNYVKQPLSQGVPRPVNQPTKAKEAVIELEEIRRLPGA